ncbi:hypothetical protein D4764_18G0007690 [Takifugu flavidus]|uniref:Uncharacterized protein n=1 Tax=Takifugu flavidus TaxID=433684 RepID=A0A5C6NRQ8_9TELE|nr:hypothetical protein D4764_18G0007690 [Takifugu flavidus]
MLPNAAENQGSAEGWSERSFGVFWERSGEEESPPCGASRSTFGRPARPSLPHPADLIASCWHGIKVGVVPVVRDRPSLPAGMRDCWKWRGAKEPQARTTRTRCQKAESNSRLMQMEEEYGQKLTKSTQLIVELQSSLGNAKEEAVRLKEATDQQLQDADAQWAEDRRKMADKADQAVKQELSSHSRVTMEAINRAPVRNIIACLATQSPLPVPSPSPSLERDTTG